MLTLSLGISLGVEAAAEEPGMPEPILTESVTDLDARKGGELEISASALGMGLAHGARIAETSIEGEWRVTDRLGLRIEPAYGYEIGAAGGSAHSFELQAAASWALMHDWRRDFHLQIELSGQGGTEGVAESARSARPGEPTLPLALDLRAGIRRGALTLRTAFGVEALGPAGDRFGVRAGVAALFGFGADARYGFAGLELEADSARPGPFVLAPNIAARAGPLGLPLKLGVALPWVVGAGPGEPRLGVALRLIYEMDLADRDDRQGSKE